MLSLSAKELDRIEFTLSRIPAPVKSILEVGVFDGRMSPRLRRRVPCYVGVDLPRRRVPEGVAPNHVFGTVAALPFSDRVFDMVLCCEVLEHLSEAVFQDSLRELPRVASQYLLVTVPYRQRIELEQSRCAHCGVVGHYTAHLRSFSEESLRDVFPGWDVSELQPFGALVNGYAPACFYRLRYRLGLYTRRAFACDACHKAVDPPLGSLPARVVQSVIWRLEQRAPMRPAWLLGLWRRRGQDTGRVRRT